MLEDCEKRFCYHPIPEGQTLPIDERDSILAQWACCNWFVTMVYQRRIQYLTSEKKSKWCSYAVTDDYKYYETFFIYYCPFCGHKLEDKPPILKQDA